MYIYIKLRSIATCFLQILHSKIHAAIPSQYYTGLTFTISPKIITSSKIAFRFFKYSSNKKHRTSAANKNLFHILNGSVTTPLRDTVVFLSQLAEPCQPNIYYQVMVLKPILLLFVFLFWETP